MYIIRTDFDQPKLMLHWHKKLNKWMQYGGHVELDEDPWQAVEHELLEESGYELGQLKLLQPQDRIKNISGTKTHPQPLAVNTHPITDTHSHIGLDYAFLTDQEPLYEIGEDESSQLMLVTQQELQQIDADSIYSGTKDLCNYVFDVCLKSWEQIPAPKSSS